MSNSFLNRTSRVAVAGRIEECSRAQGWNELTILGDYYLPFGKIAPIGPNRTRRFCASSDETGTKRQPLCRWRIGREVGLSLSAGPR